jgi:hypothetical protein
MRDHLAGSLATARVLVGLADGIDELVGLAVQLRNDAAALGVDAELAARLEPPRRAPKPDRRRVERERALREIEIADPVGSHMESNDGNTPTDKTD